MMWGLMMKCERLILLMTGLCYFNHLFIILFSSHVNHLLIIMFPSHVNHLLIFMSISHVNYIFSSCSHPMLIIFFSSYSHSILIISLSLCYSYNNITHWVCYCMWRGQKVMITPDAAAKGVIITWGPRHMR